MFYTSKPDEARAFLRDKLMLPAHDVGDGWLIMDVPEAEIVCHPSEKTFHELSFYCDDVEKTRAELEKRGVRFTTPIRDMGWGVVCSFAFPGGPDVALYQPRYRKDGA
jgi:hypothetical protein